MKAHYLSLLVAMVASAACNKPKAEGGTESHGARAMDSGMTGMAGMESPGVTAMMPAHLDSMTRMSPERMSQMMAGHERTMSQMMDQMGAEMRQMKMAETPEWSGLTDSVRQDLADLPGLTGQALSARMRAHADRVRRLMAAHEGMMKGMR